jgi:tetratricopeptide (TPR) repeat protein
LRLIARDQRVIVLEGGTAWSPESDQLLIEFSVNQPAPGTGSLRELLPGTVDDLQPRDAEAWCELALELEDAAPAEAELAYARALVLEPECTDAQVNLGRLLQLSGRTLQAIEHYRAALRAGSTDPTAAFNLGTALETLDRWAEAIQAYTEALQIDDSFADAHFNLARLYEQTGQHLAAVRHLRAYQIFSGCVSS